jgi:glycosyltransferase involved in cell wall biosynthesis
MNDNLEASTGSESLPRVVALVPAWRAAAFIQETLDSLAAQTYPNLHVLISDDASPDNTAEICEASAARRQNARVIRQPQNLGWVGNVNALLREAEGQYYFFAFHDDVLDAAYVKRLVEALQANPPAVIAFSDMSTKELDGAVERQEYSLLEGVRSAYLRGRHVAARQGDWWAPNRGLFRASAAREIGGLKKNLAGEFSADLPWLLRLALIGEFVRVPEILVAKRMTAQSVSKRWQFSDWQRCALMFSCLGAVGKSPLPLFEKLRLQAFIILHNFGRIGGRIARTFNASAEERSGQGISSATRSR